MSKTVVFIFAGREENMRVQWPFLCRLMETDPELEVHLWDLTRRASDADYIRTLEGGYDNRVKVMAHFHPGHPVRCMYPAGQERRRGYPPCRCVIHKPPYEKPYRHYASLPEVYEQATFVKIDDDVLFLETDRFGDLVNPVREFPNTVFSANVVNNAVCAKYEPALSGSISYLFDPQNPAYDKAWWALHIEPEFARASHNWFLEEWTQVSGDTGWRSPSAPAGRQPTRDGEAISINCIAFSFQVMRALGMAFQSNPRLGDEGVVDSMLPTIVSTFYAAHLSFGPQEKAMTTDELDSYRERYAQLAKDYLG